MTKMSHPSRRYTTDHKSTQEEPREELPRIVQPAAMEYEQANVEAFEAASKAVADMLSVSPVLFVL